MNACNIPASAQPSMTDNRQDSGYSSTQFPSPNGKLREPTCTEITRQGKSQSVPPAPTPIAGFAEFDKSVDNATISQFRHVHSLLEKPLLEYIRSTIRKKQCPVSIRLMVLGRSEDDAKPCIVVLCPEQQSKKVRKFFDKKSVRALRLPEDDQPSFEVFVVGREPETKQAEGDIDVFVPIVGESESYTNDTYCGAPILIRQTSCVDKRCTFGGVIKASWSNGEIKLYGLTVGHILLDDLEDDMTASTESDQSRCSYDWVFELSDSESEVECHDSAEEEQDEDTEPLSMTDELQLALPDAGSSWVADELSKIGSISKDSPRYQSAVADTLYDGPDAYYDWALIEMISYKPNLIRPRRMSHDETQEGGVFNFRDHELVMSASPSDGHGKRQPVVLLSGSEGLKRGSLSALPSRLLLGPGREFVDALILDLDGNKQILDGDSGSWVVNETTLEVYGYVVAADAFGGGYLIPLAEAFRNIADTLRCQSVDLATTIDMASAKLGRMFDINGEPTAMMAPITADHSVMPSSHIMSCISTPTTNLSITSNISRASTPATNFSITSMYDGALTLTSSPEDDPFAQEKPFAHPKIRSDYNLEPPGRPDMEDSYTEELPEYESSDGGSNNTSRPGTPTEHTEDDTAVSSRPSRQVDYLSHGWKEEDIWSSWRYIVTRRADFTNNVRLENASWRAWMKVKNNLRTVSAKSINWLKDNDVTWLYGPLQLGVKPIHGTRAERSGISLSKTDSRVTLSKKPILKKRMFKITLQRPLSTASLLKQAAATIQAQETQGSLRPKNNRHGAVDDFSYPFSPRSIIGENGDLISPTESSKIASPTTKRRQIRFNEQVEQCIAVDISADDDDEMEAYPCYAGDNSDSDDDIMLKRIRTKKRIAKSESTEDKTIAKLPSTTLKDRKDTRHPRSPPLSASPTETMLPSKPSSEFFFDEDDDDEARMILGWSFPPAESSSSSKPVKMRRTSSEILISYEAGDSNPEEGVYTCSGVVDKVNTTRRIGHVHWKRE
ncbi:uncharacterized protein Triagg1_9 [Trichoderma aggressivum f. europaeum]|uniref:Nitrogen regulatory protein areA GATA-like domain-containing protein n=1 Tax=Trichoderma aggressivum f. europaeum TaxID=173218 RepID=A0AAE1IMQ4_9HYPO|nr:hypothetical protein Triagg1_9 [Trichoderma aggressivum f. europaeum]